MGRPTRIRLRRVRRIGDSVRGERAFSAQVPETPARDERQASHVTPPHLRKSRKRHCVAGHAGVSVPGERRSAFVRAGPRNRSVQCHVGGEREEAGEPPSELGAMRVCLTRGAWRA